MIAVELLGYIMESLGDGQVRLHYNAANGNRASIVLPLKNIIEDYLNGHYQALTNLLKRFDEEDRETLYKDYTIMQLVNSVPYSSVIPGEDLKTDEQIRIFNHHQLTKAYNIIHNTEIRYEDLKI